MPIRMMTDASKADQPNVETVMDYPGAEWDRWFHWSDCPHYRTDQERHAERFPECGEHCRQHGPLYMETTRAGLVLRTYERNGRVMKIDLSGDMLSEGLYDRDNGQGAAARALAPLIAKLGD